MSTSNPQTPKPPAPNTTPLTHTQIQTFWSLVSCRQLKCIVSLPPPKCPRTSAKITEHRCEHDIWKIIISCLHHHTGSVRDKGPIIVQPSPVFPHTFSCLSPTQLPGSAKKKYIGHPPSYSLILGCRIPTHLVVLPTRWLR